MTSITLQFCSFHSFWGVAIDYFTQGKVGHVDAVLPSGSLLGAQHQAGLGDAPSGVQIRPEIYVKACDGYNITRVVIPCTIDQSEAFYKFLSDQLGKPYDVTAIKAFIVGRDWREPGAWFCSELQAAALEASGLFKFPLADQVNKITPASLLLLVSAFGETKAAA